MPVGANAFISELKELGGTLYFVMSRDGKGEELWKTDGTGSGTTRVSDINVGPGDCRPEDLTNANGVLFF